MPPPPRLRASIWPQPNAPDAQDLVQFIRGRLLSQLPPSWKVTVFSPLSTGDGNVDAVYEIEPPNSPPVAVYADVKLGTSPRDLGRVLEQLRRLAEPSAVRGPTATMIVSRYLSPTTRDRIAELGGGYADATGNLLLTVDQPTIFLRDRGADSDPWRGPGRPRGTLKGAPAARVVRALLDFAPPYSVPDLVKLAGASTGVTYRVVDFLELEGLLDRTGSRIVDVAWMALLERWSLDYGFADSNKTQTFLEPRGLRAVVERLQRGLVPEYAITGSLAAERIAPYAPPRLASLYVPDIQSAAELLNLRPVDTGGNVVLAGGQYDVAFERTTDRDSLRFAAVSQVAVDLLTGPGRNPSEGEALLDWMQRNETQWRQTRS